MMHRPCGVAKRLSGVTGLNIQDGNSLLSKCPGPRVRVKIVLMLPQKFYTKLRARCRPTSVPYPTMTAVMVSNFLDRLDLENLSQT